MAWVANPSADLARYDIVATTGVDTARLAHPVKIAPPATTPVTPAPADTVIPLSPALYAALIGPAAYPSDTDRVVTGYALAGGIQRWFLVPGTVVKVTGTRGNDAYVELDNQLTIRIARSDLDTATAVSLPSPRRAGAFRVVPSSEWTDIQIPVSDAPAYLVDQDSASLTLSLYGTAAPGPGQVTVRPPGAGYVSSVTAAATGPRMQYTIALPGPVFGYQPLWRDGVFTLRVRRPPTIDASAPLRGLTIAVDPGHPPLGATGPTGLWEPEATLPIGIRMRALLQARGVNVVMTRTAPDTVALNDRPAIARRANSHALVSIHLNAVPDGINPLRVHGTATYHYHPHSRALAKSVQQALAREMSLPDNGVKRENFALVRQTWMPSVLAEGAFIIMPDQEAALRTPEYQERYAQGLVTGLENYFRSLPGTAR